MSDDNKELIVAENAEEIEIEEIEEIETGDKDNEEIVTSCCDIEMGKIPSMDDPDNNFLEKYDAFINSYREIINQSTKVDNLLDYIQYNLNNLSDRVRIVRLKYTRYKNAYDTLNIYIIILSAFLTVFSAITNQLQTEIDKSNIAKHIIGIIPIICGAIITLIASIMKFKKLQEKMEKISNLTEKSIMVMAKLKKTSEDLYLKQNYTEDEFKTLESTFLTETCDICNNCIMQMEQITKDSDYEKYLKKIQKSDDNLSRIIFMRKEAKVRETLYHKKSDFRLETIRKARTMKEYKSVISQLEYDEQEFKKKCSKKPLEIGKNEDKKKNSKRQKN